MTDTTSKSLFEQLRQIIDLPAACRLVKIEIGMDHAPVVTAEFIPNVTTGVVTQRFELVPIEDDENATSVD